MSQPGGRGRGRAGKGQKLKQPEAGIAFPSGRAGHMPTSQLRKEYQSSESQRAGSSKSEIGDTIAAQKGIEHLSTKLSKTHLGEGDAASGAIESQGTVPLGRGGMRGRRQICTAEVVRTRPQSCTKKQGDYGARVELTTNYFRLDTMPNWALYQYRVDFTPECDQINLMRAWLAEHREKLRSAYIFDGTILFSSERLTAGDKPLTFTSISEKDKQPVRIDITFVKQLNYGNAVYLQVFNLLIRRCLRQLNLHMVNRNYFDPRGTIHLHQHNLEIWPGFLTSIRQHENGVLMCTDITHKVMRTDTALRLFNECMNESGDFKALFQQSMIGAIVLTDYNNKTYRVDDVDFSQTPLSTFTYRNNEQMTFVQYYQQRYQIKITNMSQPLLVSRASSRDLKKDDVDRQCLLVPELCRLTGLSDNMLENRNLMKDLSNITQVAPEARMDRLKGFNARLQSDPKIAEDFRLWGLKLNKNLTTVIGREFPPENLIAGNSVTYPAGAEVDWTRSVRSHPMLKAGKLDCWVIICPTRLRRETEEFVNVMKRTANEMAFRIPAPIFLEIKTDSPALLLEAVERALGKYNPDLIMFSFMTNRSDRYSAVKKKCFVDRGVQSQVILSRTLKSKGIMSIATKVAVQINCKLGGAPWSVNIPADSVMVIGYDVCHDKKKKSRSVGALVASLNHAMSAWFSSVSYHSSGEELSNSLALDVYKAIRKYREFNSNRLPSKIIMYRDGVGEGQINHVYNHEVAVLKSRLTELYGGESWKMAYIIVTKRINTKFFNRGRNPRPGTVVDDVVTLPEKYDFFLVSQSTRQGTVSPTNYNVISDNLGWGPNYIQRFTYKMTHLYYNCWASVRVPAPCNYAHKLAFMVSQSLHGQPHSNLDTSLYFL